MQNVSMHAAREISVQAGTFAGMTSSREVENAYDPERFRALGHRVVDLLADHLARAAGRDPTLPVLPPIAPDEMMTRWPARFAERGGADLVELLSRAIDESNHLQ